MSRHITASLFRNYSCKLNFIYSHFGVSHSLSASLPSLSSTHRLCSSSVPENIQTFKYVPPVIIHPIDDVLSNIDNDVISGSESVSLLKALRMQILFKGTNSNAFRNDRRFKLLCEAFERNCSQLKPNLLVSGLRSLLEVGVASNSSCVVSAEESILNNINNFSAINLIGCLYYHHKFVNTDLQKSVVSKLIAELEKRLHEISSAAEVLMLVHILDLFDKKCKKELEQKIIELIYLLDVSELCKLICVMAEKSNRNVYILNSFAFYLRQKSQKPNLKQTIDLFYAFKKLNFFDPKLFAYLLNYFALEIPSVKQASLITGLLSTCGHMGWRHSGILDKCGEWLNHNFDDCKTRDFVTYILTVAALNYTSPQVETVMHKILPHLTLENLGSPDVLLNVTWSLGVLNNLPKELLLKVLSSEFYKPLIDHADIHVKASNLLKLLNLKGILRKKYPEYIFGCDLYEKPIKLPGNPSTENSRQHVIKVLGTLVPIGKFLCTNQVSDTGIFIDAEFIIDKDCKPLPLKEFGTILKGIKPLPKGSKRIAMLIMFPKDFTQCQQELTGVNVIAKRLLEDAGYTVLMIPYEEFSKNKNEVQKVKYLSRTLKELCAR